MATQTATINLQHQEPDTTLRAQNLYRHACSRNWIQHIWTVWNKQPRTLMPLHSVQDAKAASNRTELGTQMVPISQILGSANAGRTYDFDINFRPLRSHSKDRWISVAISHQQGKRLPPVQLTKVNDIYFVVDGHHRISVAKALGEQAIEANVTLVESC
jgi:hypothetical protein